MLPIKIDLPQNFLDEEFRDGYLVTSEMKKVWAVEIDILFQIKAICDRHNIKWFADGGTLLGAVRHGGYIPWDDDIDIDMFREDYDRFIFYAKTELKEPYFLQTNETDPHSMYGHAKVRNSLTTGMQKNEFGRGYRYNMGIFVDIFPMDCVPDVIEDARKYMSDTIAVFCKARYRLYSIEYFQKLPFRRNLIKFSIDYGLRICQKIKSVIYGHKYYQKEYDKYNQMVQAYNSLPTSHVMVFAMGWKDQYYWDKSLFDGQIILKKFEWFEIPVMRKYETMLDYVFGNWRVFVLGGSVHGDLITDVETPFDKYSEK